MSYDLVNPSLFPISQVDDAGRHRPVPGLIGTRKDIRYYDTLAKGVLNAPESTGMGFWSINPYVGCAFGCAYCYARYAHRYAAERTVAIAPAAAVAEELTELPPWLAFERRIFVKRNAPEVLRAQLRARDAARHSRSRRAFADRLTRLTTGERIAIGTATDPYQPAERTFRVTRAILEVLAAERGLSVGIVTKSPLITRDIDILTALMSRSTLTVHVSLITLDRALARRIEPRAPTPEARLRAVARLSAAGIDTGVNIMPVLPGLTDRPGMLRELVRRVAGAGASHVSACALRLQATARHRYLPFIEAEFPDLAARYRAAYAESHQMSDRYRDGLRRFLRRQCREAGIRYGVEKEGAEEPLAFRATAIVPGGRAAGVGERVGAPHTPPAPDAGVQGEFHFGPADVTR